MINHASTTRGFTLMELIVAISIVGFMVFAMNAIFNEATTIVRRGTQTGEIIQRARALDQQLKQETALEYIEGVPRSKMLGPYGRNNEPDGSPGGILAIVQLAIPNVALTPEDAPDNLRPIRSDQLMFFYDQNMKVGETTRKLRALAPASDETFSGDLLNSAWAEYARVWYGHVHSLRRDGTYDANDALGDFSVAENANAYAINWVLGRHVLFLTGIQAAAPPNLPVPLPTGDNYVDGYAPTASLIGDFSGRELWEGLADVSNVSLAEITGPFDPLATPPTGFLSDPALTAANYQDLVLDRLMFGNTRLVTQPKPEIDAAMTAEQIAPMHTGFMTGVSDFIVEWAGDMYSANPATGLVSAADLTGRTYNPDGLLDRDENGDIVWYSHYHNNGVQGPYDPDYPVTWQPPGGDPAIEPYKPYNANPGYPYASAAFVWQHLGSADGPDTVGNQNAWPWMLRIRYRLHDRRGEYVGRQIIDNVTGERIEERGEWFQTIVPVNRQYPFVP